MKLKYLVLSALTILLGTTGLMTAKAYGAPPAPVQGYGQDRGGWDQAPREFREIQRQGFHDGIEGARRDVDNHRRPDVNNRDEYRHPRYVGRDAEDYRSGFRRGYDMAMSHLMNGAPVQAPPPPPQPQPYVQNRGGWDQEPQEFREVQRQGFRDGIVGFHRDMDNHRRPDPNNRDEYRNPSVPFRDRADYRAGFRRGYEAAMAHFNYR